jgi:hypothetical protein
VGSYSDTYSDIYQGDTAWFLPTPSGIKVPPRARLARMGIRSARYRNLLWTYAGTTNPDPTDPQPEGIRIGGILYRGGYWAGPLTNAEITAITAAGYASRIVYADDTGHLPANIEP